MQKELLAAQRFKLRERMPVKKTYSFTGDLKIYETCLHQYQFFREYDFTSSRSVVIFFGLLVHQTIEEIHRIALDGGLDTLDEARVRELFERTFRFLALSDARTIGDAAKGAAFQQAINYSRQNQDEMWRVIQTEVDVSFEKDLPAPRPDLFFVYAIECEDGSYYIGHTEDLYRRWAEHQRGNAAEWTRRHKPGRVAHYEEFPSRKEAVERAQYLKTGYGRKYLKRLIQAGRARQAGGKLELLDFKTSPRPRESPKLTAAYERQLCTHAHILEHRHGRHVDLLLLLY